MHIDKDIINAFKNCELRWNKLYLLDQQLDEELCLRMSAALRELGGKWHRDTRGRVSYDSNGILKRIERLLKNGHGKKYITWLFDIPWSDVQKMVEFGYIRFKEPSEEAVTKAEKSVNSFIRIQRVRK